MLLIHYVYVYKRHFLTYWTVDLLLGCSWKLKYVKMQHVAFIDKKQGVLF